MNDQSGARKLTATQHNLNLTAAKPWRSPFGTIAELVNAGVWFKSAWWNSPSSDERALFVRDDDSLSNPGVQTSEPSSLGPAGSDPAASETPAAAFVILHRLPLGNGDIPAGGFAAQHETGHYGEG